MLSGAKAVPSAFLCNWSAHVMIRVVTLDTMPITGEYLIRSHDSVRITGIAGSSFKEHSL